VISDVKPAIDENGDKPVVVTKQTGKSSSLCNIVEFFDLIHVKKAIWVTFKQGDDNRRTNIILLMVIVVILLGPLSG
jgi:PCFT/HCP family folate transporter-like MFS transporter 1/3